MHRPRKRALEECEWKPGGGFELIARPSATAKAVGGRGADWVVDTAGLLMEAAFGGGCPQRPGDRTAMPAARR
jgi:hypothetical protein